MKTKPATQLRLSLEMKVLSVLLIVCGVVSVSNAINCYQGADMAAATASTDCNNVAITKCKMPTWSYEGYSSVGFGCGECGVTANCEDCDTDDCNKPATLASDFQCYSWSYVSNAWGMAADETTCKRKDGEDITCNAPDRNQATATTDYTKQNNGCGACNSAEKSDGDCLECTSTLCNGSNIVGASALLAAVSALLFLM